MGRSHLPTESVLPAGFAGGAWRPPSLAGIEWQAPASVAEAAGEGPAPTGAQRADPLSPMAAREHLWAATRQDPRGRPHHYRFSARVLSS